MHDNAFQTYSIFLLRCMMKMQLSSKPESCTAQLKFRYSEVRAPIFLQVEIGLLQKQCCYFVLNVCTGTALHKVSTDSEGGTA